MFTLYLNPEKSPVTLQAKASGSPITALKFKRGANVPLRVVLLGTSSAQHLRMGIKAKNAFEADLLVYGEATTGIAVEEGMAFELMLNITSLALNEVLDVGGGADTAPAALAAMTEFSWLENGSLRLSDTIATTIYNDIIRLAQEAPDAAPGEYPAADLLATKSWVNNLRASAAAAGLVLLESDAVVEDEYAAVALTAAGTLAIPKASRTKRGAVKLGTGNKLSGYNILPVGEDAEGRLAVDGSRLSAYALAVARGFKGTEDEWLASLKGEQGEQGVPGERGEQGIPGTVDAETLAQMVHDEVYTSEDMEHTTAKGTTDINCRWAQISLTHCPPAGELLSVVIPCRKTSSSEMSTSAAYLGIFEENSNGDFIHLATSLNAVTQTVGAESVWMFENAALQGGKLRLCLMPNASSTALNNSLVLSGRGTYNDTDGCYLRNPGGGEEKYLIEATFTLRSHGARFAPYAHTQDTTLHLTAAEHSKLTELLANKDALLALINH